MTKVKIPYFRKERTVQNPVNIRAIALTTLDRAEAAGQYSNIALDTAIERSGTDGADRALLTSLVYGTIEHKITLDHIIDSRSSIPPSKIERTTRNILRMGLYQFIFLDRIPDHAAANESVDLAGKRSKGFVNAMLRGFVRDGKNINYPDPQKDVLHYISVMYSVPAELASLFLDTFGREKTESLFRAMNENPTITLRTNTLKTTRDELIKKLADAAIEAVKTRYSPYGIRLTSRVPYTSIAGAEEGLWHVQDEASQICAEVCAASSGDTVIDACACPGGKSFSIAENMKNEGKVLAFDLHENKLSLVRSGAERLGISIIETAEKDGKVYDPSLSEIADCVLCDVPCSGFGVLAKKPEIRYKNVSETEKLPDLQLAIAENCLKYVKKGGTFVYSTCTLVPRENVENVRRLLSAHPELEICDFEVGGLASKDGMLTFYPDEHGFDGFFVAKMKKK